MKNLIAIALICGGLTFTACDNNKRSESYENYRGYVVSHRDSMETYYDRDWNELEAEYNERKAAAERDMDKWNDEMKSEYASLEADWDQFKEDHTAERNRREMATRTETLNTNLLPSGVKADMSDVTAGNLLAVHQHFVNYVEQNKDNFSREEWDQIELLWERLDTRKNEVEKDLASADNMKIAQEKVRYGALKAVNRPTAKVEENSDAKEEAK